MKSDPTHSIKIFGAGVDASDDPWTLQLKHAAMQALENGLTGLWMDPYDALVSRLTAIHPAIEAAGKVPVPAWLRPLPDPAERDKITTEFMAGHVAGGGMFELMLQIKAFVQDSILPAMPVMLGVDHSATGGVLAALSDKIGPENLSVVIFDQHFDGLPLSLRLDPQLVMGMNVQNPGPNLADQQGGDEYCCGNFLKHLIDQGIVLARNLFFVGVADYPGEQHNQTGWERFRDNYLDFEKQGCHFFPVTSFEGDYQEALRHFLLDQISTDQVYISLDVDVGAYRCIHAARYMDSPGIDQAALMSAAGFIADGCRRGRFRLAGMDVVEFNMHFLDIAVGPGQTDNTLSTVVEVLKALLSAA